MKNVDMLQQKYGTLRTRGSFSWKKIRNSSRQAMKKSYEYSVSVSSNSAQLAMDIGALVSSRSQDCKKAVKSNIQKARSKIRRHDKLNNLSISLGTARKATNNIKTWIYSRRKNWRETLQ